MKKCLTVKRKFWDALHWMFYDPKRLIRIVILFICSIVVIFQLTECFKKLLRPPITTHSHFDLNDTLLYPSVTFCRVPPYKEDVLKKYNLESHPKFNDWDKFPFNETTLDEFFEEATYDISEYFYLDATGLDGSKDNIDIKSSMHLDYGQCQTILPRITTKKAWKEAGYNILLKHDMEKDENYFEEIVPGWHVFMHESTEEFVEKHTQTSGRVEYLHVDVKEEIEIKLTTQHLKKIPTKDTSCTEVLRFSASQCIENCYCESLVHLVGCTGPWMPEVDVPRCNNSTSMKHLLKAYNYPEEEIDAKSCGCDDPCCSTIFSAFVTNRRDYNEDEIMSKVALFYTSKVVAVIEERHAYDLTQFVADMGGSLGFLLGLSVLGLISALEKLFTLICIRKWIMENRNKQIEKENNCIERNTQEVSSISSSGFDEGEVVRDNFPSKLE